MENVKVMFLKAGEQGSKRLMYEMHIIIKDPGDGKALVVLKNRFGGISDIRNTNK